MASYHVIGGDTKEYGPIQSDDVRLWISEGRLNAQSLAKGEGETAWRTLGSFPEFAEAFRTAPPTIAPLRPAFAAATSANTNFLERDYDLDIGGCVTRGWDLIKDNMGVYVVGLLIYLLIEGGVGLVSKIPLIGWVFSLGNFVIAGPFMGGILYMFLRGTRGEPVEVGDIFSGFRRAFGQLFLAKLVQSLLIGLCLLPYLILFVVKFMALGIHLDPHNFENDPATAQQFLRTMLALVFGTLPVLLICAIPATYLATCWQFTLPLIMDKGMDFWTAMKTSFKMVNKHWWQVFGLLILIGLLNVAGVLACCIGLLFTMPIGMAALMFAYETIFGERKK